MSLRRGKFQEPVEEVAGVVRAWAGLRVVLDGAARNVLQDQPLDRPVIEIEMGELGLTEVRLPADRLVPVDLPVATGAEHREAVVLGGDVDPPGVEVLDRMVRAAVPEGELEGLEADRPAEQLVAEADPDNGLLPDHAAYVLDDVVERAGIAGPVRQEDEVGVP